ncbi:uncharacterized protein LOC127875222 [Dreissena polymorpha]|nr:uncharacterized protein LOC127875222 [Dreissena polymorpha]
MSTNMADIDKKRSANFSPNDCLLLAHIMNEPAQEGSILTRYAYLKSRFNPSITSTSKKLMWEKVGTLFNMRAEYPRDVVVLQKKWDNLIQTHRSKYQDHLFAQNKTGGGAVTTVLGPITEAIMDVVGRSSSNTVGIVETTFDSGFLQLDAFDAFSDSPGASQGLQTATAIHLPTAAPNRFNRALPVTGSGPAAIANDAASNATIETVCCSCGCHTRVQKLKEEKLTLQIKLLKRQLNYEE